MFIPKPNNTYKIISDRKLILKEKKIIIHLQVIVSSRSHGGIYTVL